VQFVGRLCSERGWSLFRFVLIMTGAVAQARGLVVGAFEGLSIDAATWSLVTQRTTLMCFVG